MTIPWLLSTHASDASPTALADTEASTSTPASNLLTREAWKVWRGTSAVSARLMFDLGAVSTVDALALCGCTAGVAATMRLSLAATIDDLFWSPTFVTDWESPYASYTAKPASALGQDVPAIITLSAGVSAGAAMLEIDDPGGTVALQASRIVIGERWQPSHGYDAARSGGWIPADSVGAAYTGGLVTAARGRHRMWTLPFSAMARDDLDAAQDIFARLGTWGDLFLNANVDADAGSRLHREAGMVAFMREPTWQGTRLWSNGSELFSVRLDFRSFD